MNGHIIFKSNKWILCSYDDATIVDVVNLSTNTTTLLVADCADKFNQYMNTLENKFPDDSLDTIIQRALAQHEMA